MEDSPAKNPDIQQTGKRRTFCSICAVFARWVFIAFLAFILWAGLYLVWVADFYFKYMWFAFGAILLLELFLVFSRSRWRQCLVKKIVQSIFILKKIFVFLIRWLFILLLAVTLLGGLYFKAPWKVLVLDAVLLALMTVIPKKNRQYGWLALAAAVLAVTVWVFIPEKDTGNWRPYTFDKDIKALNDKYSVPEGENAAKYYAEITPTDFYKGWTFKDFSNLDSEKRGPDQWDPNDETLSRPWKAEEFPELAAWLKTEKQKITPFWKAVQYDKCWFEVRTDPNSMLETLDRNSNIRKTAIVVQRMIYQDLGNNDVPGAIEKSLGLLQCSLHLQQQYTFLDELIGFALYAKSAPLVCDIAVNYPTDSDQLEQLKDKVRASLSDWNSLIDPTLEHEKAVGKNTALSTLFEINNLGKIRPEKKIIEPSAHGDAVPDIKFSKEKGVYYKEKKIPSRYWQERQWKLRKFGSWMTYNTSPEEVSKMIDRLYVELRQKVNNVEGYQEPQGWRFLLNYNLSFKSIFRLIGINSQMPAIKKIKETYTRIETLQKGTLIVLALKQFQNKNGQWPDSLEQVGEPDNGFIYKKIDDQFLLYNIGPNHLDENGKNENTRYKFDSNTSRWIQESTADDILIWPRTEEELNRMMGTEKPESPEGEGIRGIPIEF